MMVVGKRHIDHFAARLAIIAVGKMTGEAIIIIYLAVVLAWVLSGRHGAIRESGS
ncbi:hypothetical protein K457DRAFT_140099 [Linnemannia elongata AG-77]|uniref:Uncharacterized protein n=1 Tax=Linnemannia elongata AG-77 TaxID=1314771 RepID=A0A197JPA9_9FUNG|nr:hypothetical protein K457DRAFT_140099 [Linnemannia elongata AG-77]